MTTRREAVAHLLPPGAAWDDALERCAERGLEDVYFTHQYLTLNLPPGVAAQAEAFAFEQGEDRFILPYIRRPIPGWAGLWDFETAYGYGGPLSTTEEPEFLAAAWHAFEASARLQGLVAGLIRFHPLLSTERFAAHGPTRVFQERDTVWIDGRRSLESVIADYAPDTARRLRNAQRAGIVARPFTDRGALATFSGIYAQRMAGVGARDEYHFGDSYFDGIAALGPDRWTVYLVTTPDGTAIGGCLLLFSKRYCHYHLSGSLAEYFKLAPNDVLRHTVIGDVLSASRHEAIHFGGGRTSDPGDGLLAFKRKFSRQTCRFKVGACVIDPVSYEAICRRWDAANPEKQQAVGGFLLRHRY